MKVVLRLLNSQSIKPKRILVDCHVIVIPSLGLKYMCESDAVRDGCPPLQEHPDSPTSSVILFNIAHDPYETENIACRHQTRVREMTAIIDGYRVEAADYWIS